VTPDESAQALAVETLKAEGIEFEQGTIWTTDGVFRETPEKVRSFREKGAVAVEMEFSALLSAATFHRLPLTGVMAVSDELFTGKWRPGFKKNAFKQARKRMVRSVTAITKKMK
jgi:purine-nucleoside phosphorylase